MLDMAGPRRVRAKFAKVMRPLSDRAFDAVLGDFLLNKRLRPALFDSGSVFFSLGVGVWPFKWSASYNRAASFPVGSSKTFHVLQREFHSLTVARAEGPSRMGRQWQWVVAVRLNN